MAETERSSGRGLDEGDDVVEVGGGSGVVEVVHALEVEPEFGSGSQSFGDSECGLSGDAAAAG